MFQMNEVTLLEKEQIYGDNKLEIFNKITPKSAITDFAILLGGYVSITNYLGNTNNLENY